MTRCGYVAQRGPPTHGGCGRTLQGRKLRGNEGRSFKLADMGGAAATLSKGRDDECFHCGGYLEWDDESEWEGK